NQEYQDRNHNILSLSSLYKAIYCYCLRNRGIHSKACLGNVFSGILRIRSYHSSCMSSSSSSSLSRMRGTWSIAVIWLHLIAAAPGPDAPETNEAEHSHTSTGCDCMEYWTCVMSGGNPYSYCGLSESNVCCFVPQGAKPVGLFPSSNSVSQPNKGRCGKKGNDSGRDGIAEPAEWPWH
ncbi:hypothetical protein L9F63_007343, partial [Diploptera punctata]